MAAGDSDRIDIDQASAARMYDYYLGGTTNFPADRAAAQRVIAAAPNVPAIARANRAFLHRAVRYMAEAGVRQFLDIGSGVPTLGNVHEIAQQHDPVTRVVYVDVDPIAVTHAGQLLRDNPNATAIQADARFPDYIVQHPSIRDFLDYGQPIGLLMVSMLHFINDADAYPAVETFRSIISPGSYLAISHVATDSPAVTDSTSSQITNIYRATDVATTVLRDRAQIARFFGDDTTMIEPGLVWVPQWRPDASTPPADDPAATAVLAGVARKN